MLVMVVVVVLVLVVIISTLANPPLLQTLVSYLIDSKSVSVVVENLPDDRFQVCVCVCVCCVCVCVCVCVSE